MVAKDDLNVQFRKAKKEPVSKMQESWGSAKVGVLFSEKWWGSIPDLLSELMGKVADPDYKLEPTSARSLARSVLAVKYAMASAPNGGRILDAACGVGHVSHCLRANGYNVEGFDASEKAIEVAKEVAIRMGQSPDVFTVANQERLKTFPDNSFDCVIALGYIRYLDRAIHPMIYREVRRIMKPTAKFIVNFQNCLFEMFSLNEGCLKFWAQTISEVADTNQLLGKSVLQALDETIKTPKRVFDEMSVSRTMPTVSENPLTFANLAKEHGFAVDEMLFPSPHILPPHLERQVDQNKLAALKQEQFLTRTKDWRSMFMEYEFLTILSKA